LPLCIALCGGALAATTTTAESPAKTVLAADALARASLLASQRASAPERDYIAALSKRYTSGADPDFDQLAADFRDAIRLLVQKYPGDVDAQGLFAEAVMDLHPWRLWDVAGVPAPGTQDS
jgi:hypothetical protein